MDGRGGGHVQNYGTRSTGHVQLHVQIPDDNGWLEGDSLSGSSPDSARSPLEAVTGVPRSYGRSPRLEAAQLVAQQVLFHLLSTHLPTHLADTS